MNTEYPLSFDLTVSTHVRFGPGVRHEISGVVSGFGWRNVGIVVDHNLSEVPLVSGLIADLEKTSESVNVAYCRISEPTYASLEEMRIDFCDPEMQGVIGIGGGSALDMAKAMAVLVKNTGPAIIYRGFDKMTEPVLPVIAVPTTAGTGSEITPNASFVDTNERKKMGINGNAIKPKIAFLDPELTLSCPLWPTVSAGVDSIVHSTEAFAAKKANAISRFFACEGFRRVTDALPKLVESLDDIKLRSEVMYGAFLSGVALMHSGTGPAAALSYPLGVNFGVPHGIGGGIFLPHVIKHNINNNYFDYAALYTHDYTDKTKFFLCEQLLISIYEIWERLKIPSDLCDYGVGSKDIDNLIRQTMELRGALDQNPVIFHEKQIKSVLKSLIK